MDWITPDSYRRATAILYWPTALVLWLLALVVPRYRFRFRCALGRFPVLTDAQDNAPGGPRVWVHAVSVGEAGVAINLIRAIGDQAPAVSFVLSTTTATAQREAARKLPPRTRLVHAPFDFPRVVALALDAIRPDVMVFIETEIWPNWIATAHARGTPVVLLNARISERSLKRYLRIQNLTTPVLAKVSLISAASEMDAERFVRIGAPEAVVCANGNAKFDQLFEMKAAADLDRLGATYGLDGSCPVIVAGSTRTGEEAIIIDAWRALRERFPDLLLIIAPRHPQRASRVCDLLKERGIAFDLRSCLTGPANRRRHPVVVVDVIGELFGLYAFADIAFVGATLVPKGGHNILEPAIWGRPVVFGPHVEDFADAARWLLAAHACVRVDGPAALLPAFKDLLENPQHAREIGNRALERLLATEKSAHRHAAEIERFLDQPREKWS